MVNSLFPKLFSRGKIGQLEVENRIMKGPTGSSMANPDGSVSDRIVRFYEEVARGGAGVVMVEGASVARHSEPSRSLSIGANGYITGFSYLAQQIHSGGAKAALQITGGGRPATRTSPAKLPSRIPWEKWYQRGGPVPGELTVEEVQDIVKLFGDAARRAQTAGFDLVDVHGGHGGLINNFLSPAQNRRSDLYGGSLQNRMRFLIEIIRDIRKKVGPSFPLAVRLSAIDYEPGGVVLEETLEVVKVLEQNGVNLIDVSAGSHGEDIHLATCMIIPPGQNIPAAAAVKKVVRIPVMVDEAITTPQFAEEVLQSGKADFIALARPLFADPFWPLKARERRTEDIRPCIRCNDGCHDRGPWGKSNAVQCTVNAALGWDDRAIIPTSRTKNVAVIGGGPGGLEAARVCALRGHKVTLYEKRKLGGALIEASVPGFKSDLRGLISYYSTQMKKLKIKVVNEEATAKTVKGGKFDAAIVAVGASLRKPDIPGIKKQNVTDVLTVLNGKAKVGQRVHVVGGGLIGVEVGMFLAEQGKKVTFTTRQDELLRDMGHTQPAYEDKLKKQKNVTIYTGRRLESISNKGSVVVDRDGNRQEILADSIVLSSGFLPQTTLRDELEKETDFEVYAIGDCVGPRKIFDAIHEGFIVARRI